MKPILSVQHLKKIYHTPKEEIVALDDISFTVEEGEFLSIVGPSGCGKSTILSLLCGILKPTSGLIQYAPSVHIAYMLQEDSLLPFRTVLENCLLGLKITHQLSFTNIQYVRSLLKNYGLEDFIHHYPHQLSGGMRQRCALIRTLALKPDILLLDEATSALDYQSRLIISDDIYNILKKEGKTAIMVTHDIGEAISMSDKVLVLSKRPSKVQTLYTISFPEKETPMKNRQKEEFQVYYNQIWRDLDVQL